MIHVPDTRHIVNGRVIPTENYADQAYLVRTTDGAWLCDGGTERECGWGRFSTNLRPACDAGALRIAPALDGRIHRLRLYGRALRTWEAVANWRADTLGGTVSWRAG